MVDEKECCKKTMNLLKEIFPAIFTAIFGSIVMLALFYSGYSLNCQLASGLIGLSIGVIGVILGHAMSRNW